MLRVMESVERIRQWKEGGNNPLRLFHFTKCICAMHTGMVEMM